MVFRDYNQQNKSNTNLDQKAFEQVEEKNVGGERERGGGVGLVKDLLKQSITKGIFTWQ